MENLRRVLRLVTWLAVILQSHSLARSDEEPPVDGDPKLFNMILDAQKANTDRYPYGEIEVLAEVGRRGEPAQRRVEALVRWDGERQRITGKLADRSAPDGKAESKLDQHSFELVYRDNHSLIYIPDSKLMTISDVSKWGYYSLSRLRPRDWWYGKVDGGERNWAEKIGVILNRPVDYLRQVRVHRLDDEQIEVTHRSDAGNSFRIVCSLRDDGNVIVFERVDPSAGSTEKRTYAWSRDARHRCYLKACRVDRHSRTGGLWWNYEVIRFDPDKQSPQSTFDDRSVQVAPGTVIEDRIAGKRRRIGDRPVEGMSTYLDRLVPELKSRGFAIPERNQGTAP